MLSKQLPKLLGVYLNGLSRISDRSAGEKAFDYFCTPREGQLPLSSDLLFDDGLEERILAGRFHTHCYHWPAEGPLVMLLHGWESNTQRWQSLIRRLRNQGYGVLSVDAPAHGRSEGDFFTVPLYTEMIDPVVKKFRPQVLVGHSVGGVTAGYYLTHCQPPDSFERLVMIGVPSELQDMLDYFADIIGAGPRVRLALADYFQEKFGRPVHYFSIKEFVRQLDIGGLVVHDKQDEVAGFHNGIDIHENWADSELFVTEGLGHSTQSPRVDDRILQHLNAFYQGSAQ